MNSFHDRCGALEVILGDILSAIKPLEEDTVTRVHIINDLTSAVKSVESLRGATVEPFGSFISNLYTRWGDLDISIEIQSDSDILSVAKKQKVKLLDYLRKALRQRGVARRVEFIRSARVPVLKFDSNRRNISCDISVCNLMGQIKSKFLLWIAEIDERFRDMVLLVKEWAKAQYINDPKTGTLNSYSLALLVIFHFQTCKPAILPPLHEIYAGDVANDLTGVRETVEANIQEMCAANITRFKTSSGRSLNESSLAELFVSFFQKFSRINAMAVEHVISTYTGKWELRESNETWMSKTYPLYIQDPYEQVENTARAVGTVDSLRRIAGAFASTYSILSGNQDQSVMITTLVGSHASSKVLQGTRGNSNARRSQSSSTVRSTQHQYHNMPMENQPRTYIPERPQYPSPVLPTQNQDWYSQFQAHPSYNTYSQRPPISYTVPPPQNQFQNMQFETHPNSGVFSPRPAAGPVGYQNNIQTETQFTSNASSQRPGQAVRGRGQQMWRPRPPGY